MKCCASSRRKHHAATRARRERAADFVEASGLLCRVDVPCDYGAVDKRGRGWSRCGFQLSRGWWAGREEQDEHDETHHCRQQAVETFDAWGYAHVIPPLVEYEDSLLPADGDDLARQTFRLVDPLTGGMLGIRADITPQIARIAARYFDLQRPVRLSYVGDTLQAKPSSLNLSRNPLQMGAELIGNSGSAGDVEIVRLMVESLRQLGVDAHLLLGDGRDAARRLGVDLPAAPVRREGHAGRDHDSSPDLLVTRVLLLPCATL